MNADWRDTPHVHAGTDCRGGRDCPARAQSAPAPSEEGHGAEHGHIAQVHPNGMLSTRLAESGEWFCEHCGMGVPEAFDSDAGGVRGSGSQDAGDSQVRPLASVPMASEEAARRYYGLPPFDSLESEAAHPAPVETREQIKAEALREAARCPIPDGPMNVRRWLHDRADRIGGER